MLPRRYQLPRPPGQPAPGERRHKVLTPKRLERFLGFKERRRAEKQAAREDYRAATAEVPPAPGNYRDGRRSPTPPVRRRVVLREAPGVRGYHPERPVDETAGGRSTSPSRREAVAAPAAEKGPAKGAGKAQKGGSQKGPAKSQKGQKGGKGGKDGKNRQG